MPHDTILKSNKIEKLELSLSELKRVVEVDSKEKDQEIQKLRRQTQIKPSESTTIIELESKLKSMTERLITYQTQIKNLKSEKATYQLQVENLQIRIQTMNKLENEYPLGDTNRRTIKSLVQPQSPSFEDPGYVRGKVVKAASALDSLTSYIGYFLYRYPLARLLVILYMIFLHLYVMIVLSSWSAVIESQSNKIIT